MTGVVHRVAVSCKGLLEVYLFNWLWLGQGTLMVGSLFSFSMSAYSPFVVVVVVVLCCMSMGHTLMCGLGLLLQKNLGTEDVGLIVSVFE